MFSYGHQLELRPTEVKALMRYTYRMAKLTKSTTELYKAEEAKFGSAKKGASPICLQMDSGQSLMCRNQQLLLHNKQKSMKAYRCYQTGSMFTLTLRMKPRKGYESITWYKNWVKLSAILGGIGRRSRRGRGCFMIDDMPKATDLLCWISEQLNAVNEQAVFKVKNNILNNTNHDMKAIHHPVIEKIQIGEEIKDITEFLRKTDNASHRIKKERSQKFFATGFVNGKRRFASSLIVSVTKTADQKLLPVYTFVKPIYRRVDLSKTDERIKFIELIEGGVKV